MKAPVTKLCCRKSVERRVRQPYIDLLSCPVHSGEQVTCFIRLTSFVGAASVYRDHMVGEGVCGGFALVGDVVVRPP